MVRGNIDNRDPSLRLPRILCLHGGGTNAFIFHAQCRSLIAQLKSEFRLVFAEAPFSSQAGPDVMSVYSKCGPFKRWLRWQPEQPYVSPDDMVRELDEALEKAKRRDDACGATGEWVGLLGFSQGAKLCASLLYRQQVRVETMGRHFAGSNYRFGVLLAGRAPFVDLDPDITLAHPLPDASQITDFTSFDNTAPDGKPRHVLRIPTIHVHGMRDQGLQLHRRLYDEYCEPNSRKLVEWDGDHRVPLKLNDVRPVVNHIRDLATQAGVYQPISSLEEKKMEQPVSIWQTALLA